MSSKPNDRNLEHLKTSYRNSDSTAYVETDRYQPEIRKGLIRTIAASLFVASILGLLTSIGSLLNGVSWTFGVGSLVVGLTALVSFFLATSHPRLAGYLLTGVVLVGATIFQVGNINTDSESLVAGFILVPVLAGIIGLNLIETTVSAILAAILLVLSLTLKELLAKHSAPYQFPFIVIINWLLTYGLASVGTIVFTQRTEKSARLVSSQNKRLRRLVSALNETTVSSIELSDDLRGLTSELNVTSHQQASSTQEQVAAVTQVTSSLEELNESANRIALSAKSVVESANQAVSVAAEVKHASQVSQDTAVNGNKAVEQVVASVQRMRDNIEQMAGRLVNLTEQTKKVGKIVDLINGIAEETHLLALNASIEASGTVGGSGNGRSGERFGVIAVEVKNLADRSKESTKEIRETIREMQNAVAAAVLTAEEGRKETFAAVERSQQSGEVIHTLTEVITESSYRAEQIVEAAEKVRIRCDEISLATNQQRSANQQIVLTMREIGRLSQDSASSVSQLATMAVGVNEQVTRLNAMLQRSEGLRN